MSEFTPKTVLTLVDSKGEKTFEFSGKKARVNGELSDKNYGILANAAAAVATMNLKTDSFSESVNVIHAAAASMPDDTMINIMDNDSGLNVEISKAALDVLKTLIENVKITKPARVGKVTGDAVLTF